MVQDQSDKTPRTPSTRSVLAVFKRLPTLDAKRTTMETLRLYLEEEERAEVKRLAELKERNDRLKQLTDLITAEGFTLQELQGYQDGTAATVGRTKPRRRQQSKQVQDPAPQPGPLDEKGDTLPKG